MFEELSIFLSGEGTIEISLSNLPALALGFYNILISEDSLDYLEFDISTDLESTEDLVGCYFF